MIFPAARLDGLQFLDIQQPGPLIDHLLEMPQGQPLPCPHVYENVPLLSVPHIMPQHLAALILPVSFMVLGAHVAPSPAVVFGSVLRMRIIYLIFQVKQGAWFFLMFC